MMPRRMRLDLTPPDIITSMQMVPGGTRGRFILVVSFNLVVVRYLSVLFRERKPTEKSLVRSRLKHSNMQEKDAQMQDLARGGAPDGYPFLLLLAAGFLTSSSLPSLPSLPSLSSSGSNREYS